MTQPVPALMSLRPDGFRFAEIYAPGLESQALSLLPKTREGLAGVLSAVCAGEHRHHLTKNSIPNEIREATDKCPVNISIRNLVYEWGLSKSVKDLRDFGTELGAEAPSLSLVPKLRLRNVEFGGATDLDLESQRSRSSRVFTSGQGL